MEKYKNIGSGLKKENQAKLNIQLIKENIIKNLEEKLLIGEEQKNEINTFKDLQEYIKSLYSDKKIDKEEFLNIWVNSGVLKLGNYLVLKGLIKNEQLEIALKIQSEQNTKKELGEILVEENIITYEELINSLAELGKIRLGEYLFKKNKISKKQIEMYLKVQKHKNIEFGQILIDFKVIKKEELYKILKDLGIEDEKTNLDYYKIKFPTIEPKIKDKDESDDFEYYKLKE